MLTRIDAPAKEIEAFYAKSIGIGAVLILIVIALIMSFASNLIYSKLVTLTGQNNIPKIIGHVFGKKTQLFTSLLIFMHIFASFVSTYNILIKFIVNIS